ncbi:MAG: hypothetical protein U0599_03795 [Vicinamibacteria bacterium]
MRLVRGREGDRVDVKVTPVIAAAIIITGPSSRAGLTPTARSATISLSLAIRPNARRTPRRNAIGIVTARIDSRRFTKTRTIVSRSALPRLLRTARRQGSGR